MASYMVHTRLRRLANLSLKDFRALDRSGTVVLLPVGMLEEHADHLPLGTDSFAVEAVTTAAAAWLLEGDTRLQVLLLPTVPYGTDPVDLRRPELFAHSGSVWLSRETFKSVIADLLGHMIRYGFRWIFPVGFHGGKDQSIVLEEVCTEMRARHPGLVMYEPMGYVKEGAEEDMIPGLATLLGRPLNPEEEVALKGSIHASMFETSMMLHLRPELVNPIYKTLRSIEWNQLYQMPDWPGYVGAGPAHANADIGAAVLRWWGVRIGELIRRAMDGEDIARLPRHPRWYYEEEEEMPTVQQARSRPAGPEIDSKPEMFFSSEDLTGRRKKAPPDRDRTPPASLAKTEQGIGRPPEDGDDE
jgi:creatinine amidohydrolase